MFKYKAFIFGSLIVCALPVLAAAQVGHAFVISGLVCRAASCRVAQGMQAGLSTVEMSGTLPQYAGMSVRLLVARKHGNTFTMVVDRRLGIMSNGEFTASIAAYNFADGTYVIAISPLNNPDNPIAAGRFTKTERGSPIRAATRSSLAGNWQGINGTAGLIQISPRGRYTFNGAPGRYRTSGNQITFSGPLSAWNGGRAIVRSSTIEFYWTSASGAKQYFVFEKV